MSYLSAPQTTFVLPFVGVTIGQPRLPKPVPLPFGIAVAFVLLINKRGGKMVKGLRLTESKIITQRETGVWGKMLQLGFSQTLAPPRLLGTLLESVDALLQEQV